METFFIPFTFALMVRLVIFLIIPIFFPSVLDYYYAGPFILFLAFLLWFAQSALLQVDYSRMMQIDKAIPWYKSTSVVLCSLASIYFASELLSTDIHFTIAFLIITALILSEQANLYIFEAKFLKAKELDVWVSMEVAEPITVYPIYPLDWVYVLSTILDHVIDQAKDSGQKYLSYAYFKDEDSQHFVVESSSTKEDSAITSDFLIPN